MARKADPDRIVAARLSGSAWRLAEAPNAEAVRELADLAAKHSNPHAALDHAASYYRNRLAAGDIYPERAETAIRLLQAVDSQHA